MSECKKNGFIAENLQELNTLDDTIQNLIRQATKAREFAYCPYSKFKVGSAVLCDDGTIYTGCNIENSAFSGGICAERSAYSNAISQGKRKFKAVAVIAHQEKKFTPPCGVCRQFMSEFGNVDVYISKPAAEDVLCLNLDQLLPLQFETTNQQFI
ncbi:unnamed protein product [Ceutorhynchus assimilis]|uniref:Cytidine deaminase n=1 Tax=Ceutorhynchus assimilis TaxID=467358 RepID=A0A9P0GPR4_9CUCU|nr:unnamed protein product [Ceutorhynchus assimilis]